MWKYVLRIIRSNFEPKNFTKTVREECHFIQISDHFQNFSIPDQVNLIQLESQNYPIDYSKNKILKNCSKYSLAKIQNGRYFQHRGLDIIAYKRNLLPFLTVNVDYMNLPSNYLDETLALGKFPKRIKIRGKSLFLTTMGAGNVYGEWVTGLIPKIGFLYGFGYDFNDFDYVVINAPTKPWQKEFLTILNIPSNKLIKTDGSKSYLFEELYVPFGSGHSIKGFQFLRSIHDSLIKNSSIIRNKRYYLSRNKDNWMKVINEDQLSSILKKYNIEVIYIQNYSVLEQIQIFQESELIISPQGSGLTNIVFSNPKTKFIELYAESNLNSTFQCYGYYNGNPYGSLICSDVHSGFGDKFNIIVNPSEFDEIINKVINI